MIILVLSLLAVDNFLLDSLTDEPTILRMYARNNDIRHKAGKAPQELNERLCKHAMDHARWMAANRRLQHSPWQNRAGWGSWVAESCIAIYSDDPIGAMSDPVNTPAHRENTLANYRYCGFGYAYAADGRPYWVACYGN